MSAATVAVLTGSLAAALVIGQAIGYRAELLCRQQGKVWVTSPRDGQHACLPYNALEPAR